MKKRSFDWSLFKASVTFGFSALYFSLLLLGCAAVQPSERGQAHAFEFAVIGDQQYDAESEAKFPNLMNDLNDSELAFVVHVGDIGATPNGSCKDETFYRRKNEFQQSRHPFIFTPGDNEWADCYGPKAGGYNPTERLAKLREVFFHDQESLGQSTLHLTHQSENPDYAKFRENVRWIYGDVLFVTLNMPGGNNNLGRTAEMDSEYKERDGANLLWLRDAFEMAKRDGNRAVMIFTQANPYFEDNLPPRRVGSLRVGPPEHKQSGFSNFLATLETETVRFGGPVVLVHGDTHYFRIDKPLFDSHTKNVAGGRGRQIENFTRVEVFGFPESHWLRVIVDPNDPNLFTFKQAIVKKNLVNHSSK